MRARIAAATPRTIATPLPAVQSDLLRRVSTSPRARDRNLGCPGHTAVRWCTHCAVPPPHEQAAFLPFVRSVIPILTGNLYISSRCWSCGTGGSAGRGRRAAIVPDATAPPHRAHGSTPRSSGRAASGAKAGSDAVGFCAIAGSRRIAFNAIRSAARVVSSVPARSDRGSQ
jgi:hypothetical protein